ncbi:MAG: winged helix-turn-helix domain-containing protein [Caulobacteraceae bacterium]
MALAAQGLARERPPGPVARRDLRRLAQKLGAIQIDSVNVLIRAHYLPAFSRLGPYATADLDRLAWGPRRMLFEYWGHEASLIPVEMQPLFRWRMAAWRRKAQALDADRRRKMAEVLARIRAEGALTGGDFAEEPGRSGWWEWSEGKRALEWLFLCGELAIRTRRGFERVYDLPERVLPAAILALPDPTEAEACRALLLAALRALGVATRADLADYFRLEIRQARPRLEELVEEGLAIPVKVRGWAEPAFLDPDATRPRRARGAALLSPFDNLIWSGRLRRRERIERLFGVHYRIGIYTPAAARTHGYYVLLFLLGEAIAARVDLKADRRASALLVKGAHLEPGAAMKETAEALAGELAAMAAWLGLERIEVAGSGDLSPALAAPLRRSSFPSWPTEVSATHARRRSP